MTMVTEIILIKVNIIQMSAWWCSGKESDCQAGDVSSIPGSGRSQEEIAAHSSILAWGIPWTEEPERSIGSQKSRTLQQLNNNNKCAKYIIFSVISHLIPISYEWKLLLCAFLGNHNGGSLSTLLKIRVKSQMSLE